MEWQRLRIEAARLRALVTSPVGDVRGDLVAIYLALALLLDAEADRLAEMHP